LNLSNEPAHLRTCQIGKASFTNVTPLDKEGLPLRKAVFLFLIVLFIVFLLVPHQVAEAGMWSNIKGIFSAPAKIDALEQQYMDARQQLDEQKKHLAESLLQAEQIAAKQAEQYAAKQEELIQQNEQFRKANEQLMEQNKSLIQEMELAKQKQASFTQKLFHTALICISLITAYFLSLRVWRFLVWRKQKQVSRGV
jgi:predicted PurR-regulated permease PerM